MIEIDECDEIDIIVISILLIILLADNHLIDMYEVIDEIETDLELVDVDFRLILLDEIDEQHIEVIDNKVDDMLLEVDDEHDENDEKVELL